MSDFLDRMALRSQGAAPVLRPRPLALFEGGPEMFEEVHLEREAPPAPWAHTPSLAARRPAGPPPPSGRPAEAGPAPLQDDRPEAAPARAAPPPAATRIRIAPAEAVEDPFRPVPGEAAAPPPSAAPAPGLAPAPAVPAAAAFVRRRAAEAPAAVFAEGGRPWPLADSPPAAADRVPDPEPPASAPARLDEPPWREEAVRDAPSPGPAPSVSVRAGAPDAVPAGRDAPPEPAPSPARSLDAPPRAVPPRPGPAVDAIAPAAIPATFGAHPLAPRADAAPAPIEIRIGRIDIHAAPPAAAPPPAEAPGPSLDAFLARPRR